MSQTIEASRPRAITCDAVRAICEADGKDYAVLVAHDRAAGTFQYTTWGRTPADKVEAKTAADWVSEQMGSAPAPAEVHESFVLQAAEVKAALEAADRTARAAGQRLLTLAEFCPHHVADELRTLADRLKGSTTPSKS